MKNNDHKTGIIPGLLSCIKNGVLDVLFPIECLSCGREGEWFCNDCIRKLRPLTDHGCIFCGNNNLSGATCKNCRKTHSLDGVFSAGNYDQKELADAIKKFKYSLITSLADPLSEFIVKTIKDHRLSFDSGLFSGARSICAIPLHHKRLKWRGFNQSELVAENLIKKTEWKRLDGLKRTKNNRPQAKIGESERMDNLRGCFSYGGESLQGRKIILIDDVATTGATLESAAKTLKDFGAASVWGLTIAKG